MNLSERIIVIGASQSGKTYWICENIIPFFGMIHYFGPNLNNKSIITAAKTNKITFNENCFNSINVFKTCRLFETQFPGVFIPPQLIIFDDMINSDFIKSDECRILFCACRHYNLSIVLCCHSPNVVITPTMKGNCTQLVLCEYFNTTQFNKFIEEYFLNMLSETGDTAVELKKKLNDCINEAFKYKYGKLIIRLMERTWDIYRPKNLELRTASRQARDVITFAKKRPKAYEEYLKFNDTFNDL